MGKNTQQTILTSRKTLEYPIKSITKPIIRPRINVFSGKNFAAFKNECYISANFS